MSLWTRFFQRKLVDLDYLNHSEWLRCLSLIDIFSLTMSPAVAPCIFSLLPTGLQFAGPSAILGVFLAGIASIVAGHHYLELARLYPKSGSAYEYSFAVYGELTAFCTGWLMSCDYFLASAFLSKELSEHLDFLFNQRISTAFNYNSTGSQLVLGVFHPTPDVPAMMAVLIAVLICCTGPKVVAIICTILTCLSLMIISSSVLVGFFYADSANWRKSGFASHGATGVSFSASLTVIGFLGVEYLTCLVEEARKPLRYWRYVLQSSASICFILAITTTLVISLILPCQSLPIHAALPAIYGRVNVSASRYVLSIATVSGLSASLVAVNLAPARVLHAMSKDKLICPMFGWVTAGSGAPWVAYMCGVVPTLLAILLRTETLTSILRLTVPARFISMVTAGCLMRYRVDDHPDLSHESQPNHNNYQTFRDVRKVRSYSFTSADGSVISQEVPPSFIPEESDMKSVTSSFILQSIATATLKLNSDSEQNSATSKQNEKTPQLTGCEKHSTKPINLVRSVSGLMPITNHNCLFSPCGAERDHNHIYKATGPCLPYVKSFDAASDSHNKRLTADDDTESYTKAKFHLLVIITSALIASQFGLTAEPLLQRQTVWTAVILAVVCCIAAVATILLIRLPRSENHSKNGVPLFPHLSLLAIFLLTFAIASVPISAYLIVLAILSPGVVFYLIYGVKNSRQRNNRVSDESYIEEWPTPSVSKVTLTNFSVSNTTHSNDTYDN